MSRRRSHDSRIGNRRVEGRFIALPHAVVLSDAYRELSHPARSLLTEIAVQYMGCNNGQLLASQSKLLPRGWRSADTLHRAKQELLEAGFVVETVKGGRPNKASWYAITWWRLDGHPKYDFGVELEFRRTPLPSLKKNASPPAGEERLRAPPKQLARTSSRGALQTHGALPSAPRDGAPLEMPAEEPAAPCSKSAEGACPSECVAAAATPPRRWRAA